MASFRDEVRKRAIRASTSLRVDGCVTRVDGVPSTPGDTGLISLLTGLPAGQEIVVRNSNETSETGIISRTNQVLTAGDLAAAVKAHIRAYYQAAGGEVPSYAADERQRRGKDAAK